MTSTTLTLEMLERMAALLERARQIRLGRQRASA